MLEWEQENLSKYVIHYSFPAALVEAGSPKRTRFWNDVGSAISNVSEVAIFLDGKSWIYDLAPDKRFGEEGGLPN